MNLSLRPNFAMSTGEHWVEHCVLLPLCRVALLIQDARLPLIQVVYLDERGAMWKPRWQALVHLGATVHLRLITKQLAPWQSAPCQVRCWKCGNMSRSCRKLRLQPSQRWRSSRRNVRERREIRAVVR